MANEWTVVELFGVNNGGTQIRYTIADGLSVSKGTLLGLADERAAVAQAVLIRPAGVAAEEHIANKGITSISLWQNGVFRVIASGAILIGDSLIAGGVGEPNVVTSSALVHEWTGMKALDAVSTDGEMSVRLNL